MSVDFSATADWNGTETVTFTINDNQGRAIATDIVDVIVTLVNDGPFVSNALVDFNMDEDTEDTSINLHNVFSDADLVYGDVLTYSNTGNVNIAVSIDQVSGIVTLDPADDWFGAETINFTATDIDNANISDDAVITVINVNDDPTITLPDEFTFAEDTNLVEDFSTFIHDIEQDDDELTLTVTGNADISIIVTDMSVEFSTKDNWYGTETVTFTINDNQERAIATDTADVTVNPVNDDPYIMTNLEDYILEEDFESFDKNLNDYFADDDVNDILSYSAEFDAEIVDITIDDNMLMISSVLHANGIASITVTADDQNGKSQISDSFEIEIQAINDAPTAIFPINDIIEIEDFTTEHEINLDDHFVDPDSDLMYSVEYTSIEINAEIDSNILRLRAVHNWNGTTEITVTADDLENNKDTSQITFQVIIDQVIDVPLINVETTELQFGLVYVGDQSAIQEFIVENVGDTLLTIYSLTAPTGYKVRSSGNSVWKDFLQQVIIQEDDIRTIQVILQPESQQIFEGQIEIISNATNDPDIAIQLTGGETKNAEPNAFTPNGDGKNEEFTLKINTNDNQPLKLLIYNLQGRLIKEISGNTAQPISWDGKDDDNNECGTNPYLYVLRKNGSVYKRGKIYLVR